MKQVKVSSALSEKESSDMMREFESVVQWMREQRVLRRIVPVSAPTKQPSADSAQQ